MIEDIEMTLIDILRKINNKLSNKVVSGQTLSYQEQNDYLLSLPEPKNDIERSYNQYLCQVFSGENRFSLFIKNVASAVMLPIYYHKKYKFEKKKTEIDRPSVYIMVNNKMDMLPDELKDSGKLIGIPYGEGFYLDEDDLAYIKIIKKAHPHACYFVYKTLLKIGLYSSIIKQYDPAEIVVNAETSYTSSILTDYCENHAVKHIDVMHGEKVFWIRDAFFRFTKCYVWTEYHANLFRSMRATKSEYIVSLPPAMRFDASKVKIDKNKTVEYKFYLGYETQQTIEVFKRIINGLEAKGKKCMLRPHPVYTDTSLLGKYFSKEQIEDPKSVGIEESILTTRNVVSIFSTVLRQAYYAGVRVVVDDCSNVAKYKEMKALKFWLYETDHILLSNELRNIS